LPSGPDNLYTSAAHLRLARAEKTKRKKPDLDVLYFRGAGDVVWLPLPASLPREAPAARLEFLPFQKGRLISWRFFHFKPSARCRLLAQFWSLLDQSGHWWILALAGLSANDAVDGARSAASKCHRVVASKQTTLRGAVHGRD
jgi:hypothetical protein